MFTEVPSLFRRLAAQWVDTIVSGVCLASIGYFAPIAVVFKLAVDGVCLYLFNGQTLGKYLLSIRIYNIKKPSKRLSVEQIAQLLVTTLIGNALLGIDNLWAVLDFAGAHRSIHNIMSNTIVLGADFTQIAEE